jgi:putative addiction module antidote
MALTLKLTAIGNSLGVVLPRELLSKLRIDKGDNLYVIETPDGIELTPFDPELAQQMQAAEDVMRKNRSVLRKLAK